MRRFTHLGRTLSLAIPSHRVLAVLVALGAAGGWVAPGDDPPAVAMFRTGATVAVAWMLVRELEPDRPWVAHVGAFGAGAAVVATGRADVAALVVLMFAARILTRSVGLFPRLTDIVAVGVFAGVFARTPLAWAAGLGLACAVALDTNHDQPSPLPHTWLALAIGVAVTISVVFSDALDLVWAPPGWLTWAMGTTGLGALLTAPSTPASRNDVAEPFDPTRIRSTRVLTAASVALGTLAGGSLHAPATWPAWIALVATGIGAHLATTNRLPP